MNCWYILSVICVFKKKRIGIKVSIDRTSFQNTSNISFLLYCHISISFDILKHERMSGIRLR